MKRNTPTKYAALLSTLLISSSSTLAVAQEASQPKLSPEVSNLLNKLMNKKPKASALTPVKAVATSDADATTTSDEALTPREFARSEQRTAPVKNKPKSIIIAPRPVEIGPTMPLAFQPKAKRSLPDFVHNIYVRADYGVGTPGRIKSDTTYIHFERGSMYGGGIGYKFNQALRADINFQHRQWRKKRVGNNILDNRIDKVQQRAIFLNSYLYLMDDESYVAPFITAGIGYVENKIQDMNRTATDAGATATVHSRGTATNLAWNAGVGAALRLTKNLQVEACYKFIDIGKVNAYNVFSSSTGSTPITLPFFNKRTHIHEISGGLVINF